ncbi:hypothetical protein BO70DRAFT_286230 [Aspergillus heteromorphus CBS 117.55]|uniref:PLP-dependent transferase n=1 Tax=Aspergillus heteromorphus CBS 117.55 TaxID=1448321 RepID=A0A317WR52_9EURO|nr:uncharacterized protein BO70DRAFT_286230 [Aspergillus heteromorphus CBS 117.55]PWY88535.1 hypothetical protein BO70DRAFT_286230 [Aspergillus heteromorphus CBS 117.55]
MTAVSHWPGSFRTADPKGRETPLLSIVDAWSLLLSRLKQTSETIKQRFDERSRVGEKKDIRADEWCTSIFLEAYTRLLKLTTEFEMQLAITKTEGQSASANTPASSFSLTVWQIEERYRALIQLQSFVGSLFERATPSYDQSKVFWWFDPSYYQSTGINYDRFGSPDVRDFEKRLLDALQLGNQQPVKLALTSSGMSAFSVLQQYVLQEVVKAGDTIVVSPYIYFESFQHLRPLSHVQVVNSETFEAEDIIATAERHNAKVVYVDPMVNTVGLETTDLRKFAQMVSSRDGWSDRHVIIDGTLVSGGMEVYNWFHGPHAPQVLYYESAHKYIQMGMDVIMCGFTVYPEALDSTMSLIRQNTGSVLYSRMVTVLPPIDSTVHQSRMSWITTNAEKLYLILEKRNIGVAEFMFPTHWRRMGWRHGGNVVTIRFYGEGMNKRPSLEACSDLILRAAEEEGVAMTKGAGLGFSITRIYESLAFIKNVDPYLRVSVGVDPKDVEPVARAILKGVERHCRLYHPPMVHLKSKANGNGIPANGNGFPANGNGFPANGNGFPANGNGFPANGNGTIVRFNGFPPKVEI